MIHSGSILPRVPKGVCAFLLAGAFGASGLLGVGRAAATEGYPRILSVNASQAPQVEIEAVVPPLLAGQTVPVDAFSVVENGRRLPLTSVTRVAPADLRVVLVLDTAVSAATLAAEQGAARDFVFELPPQAQIGVVSTDPEPSVVIPLGTDRGATIRAVVGLAPTAPNSAGDVTRTLELALGELKPAVGTAVVVMVDSRPTATAVPGSVSSAATATDSTVYPIVLADPPPGYLGGLPGRSGGRVLPVESAERLLSAYEVVVGETLSRYRIAFRTTTSGSHTADLTVSSQGIRGTTAFVVQPGIGPSSTPNRNEFKGSTRKKTSGASTRLLVGLLLVGLLLRLAWRVTRRT